MNYEFFFSSKSSTKVILADGVPLVVLVDAKNATWVCGDPFPLWDALILHVQGPVVFEDQVATQVMSYIREADGPSSADNLSRLFDFTFVAALQQDPLRPSSTTVRSTTIDGALHLMFDNSHTLSSIKLTITPKKAP